jgi:inner membrane protein
MLIAHLPAGYVCTRLVLSQTATPVSEADRKIWFLAGMAASVLPDTDVAFYYLRYYLTGQWWPPHHAYVSHTPFFWLVILTALWIASRWVGQRRLRGAIGIAGVNLLLHFLLDSIPTKVKWLYPFSNRAFGVFVVTIRSDWWVWDRLFNWTFGLELLIVALGLYAVIKDVWPAPGCIHGALSALNRVGGE